MVQVCTDPTTAWVSHITPGTQHHFNAPHPVCNHFLKGFISDGTEAALSVTVAPDHSQLSLVEIACLYVLPDFTAKIQEYITRCTNNDDCSILQKFSKVKLWYNFHIQQCSMSEPLVILPSQAVQAQPPSANFPLGNCDAVLLNVDGGSCHNPRCKFFLYALRIGTDYRCRSCSPS